MIITAIGSRQTPNHILREMEKFGEEARARGWWLRSGRASGADSAFEMGARDQCLVYLPWPSFNEHLKVSQRDGVVTLTKNLKVICESTQPGYRTYSQSVQKLFARDVCQVLGSKLNRPSDYCIYWTPRGATPIGGTAFTVKVAKNYEVPCLDMDLYGTADALLDRILGHTCPDFLPCAVCAKNPVWVGGGYDTCHTCLSLQ